MVHFQSVQIIRNIEWQYVYEEHGYQVQTLFDNSQTEIRNAYFTITEPGWVNGFCEELGCFTEIVSLGETPLPTITDEDSDTDRLVKSLERE